MPKARFRRKFCLKPGVLAFGMPGGDGSWRVMNHEEKIVPPEVSPVPAPIRRRRKRALVSHDQERARQREVCHELLGRWVPLATSEALAIEKEVRGKAVLDEEPVETGLKAGAFVLKVLERLARLDGLDAAEKREVTLTEVADPLELARRVEAISPLLAERLKLPMAGRKTGEAVAVEAPLPLPPGG